MSSSSQTVAQQSNGRPPSTRLEPGPYHCAVFAYPSFGGIVIGHFTGVELEWLGLPRSSDGTHLRSEADAATEDAFALRVMQLGGHWWPSRRFYDRHSSSQYPLGHHYPPDVDVGYPASGATLVLKTFHGASPWLSGLDEPEKPNDWSRLAACGGMEERCDVLRSFGASEFPPGVRCPDLPDSLEAGIEERRRYEASLTRIQDRTYLDQWLMSL
ncbi:hypothetical protein F4778DRAFT_731065 [Xylariomycetidae sp. FL2044]|nr:hypothetical protein F4778DRAFT_731065 [Xylariomycetidae sp. FL2044]